MNKDSIKKKYKEKIKLINYYNKRYFEENTSEIDDAKYDILKNEINLLEKKYFFLKDQNSPSVKIGFKPSKNFKNILIEFQCYL